MDMLLQLIAGKRRRPSTPRSSNSNRNSNRPHISRRPSSDTTSSNAVTITKDDSSAQTRPIYMPGHNGQQVDIPLMCEVLNTRRDFTPAVKRAMEAIEAARPETWEQKMLRKSKRRWRKMTRAGDEERMWQRLGWESGLWVW